MRHFGVPRIVAVAAGMILLAAAGCHHLPVHEMPAATVNRKAIVDKLRTFLFDSLDAELTTYNRQEGNDPRQEMNIIAAFAAFDSDSPLISLQVQKWAEKAPQSRMAALARASSLIGKAYRWSEATPTPSSAEGQQIGQNLADATRMIDRALASDPKLGIAYALRIKAARVRRDKPAFERAVNDGLAHAPGSFAVREQIMYGLRPRWLGSQAEMRRFAQSSQEFTNRNPAMRFLNGWVALDTGDALAEGKHWHDAIAAYSEALKAGGEYWVTYRRRANAYYALQRWGDAVADGRRAELLFPDNSDVLRLLAWASAKQHDPVDAIGWLSLLMVFEPPDASMFGLLATDQQDLIAQGKTNAPMPKYIR
jgi:tetratricopeptide (TPR) repeat protein